MSETYAKPLPRVDDLNRPHWEGARAGELRVQRCQGCGALRYPASRWCPKCLSEDTEWVATSGRGAVWSWCVFHRAYFKGFEPELPYTVALIELDEGVRIYSNVLDVPDGQLRIGMRVCAVFEPATPEITLVKFRKDR